MKTRLGRWMVLVGMGLSGSAAGCASELDAEEMEAALGSEEATPFDEQYFDFSMSWQNETLSEMVEGKFDPNHYDDFIYEDQCTFKASFHVDDKQVLAVSGRPAMHARTLGGSGMLTRSQLKGDLSVRLGIECASKELQLRLGADLVFPAMMLGDQLNVEQKTPLVPKVQNVIRKDMPFLFSLKIKHARPTAGVLSNCSAFSNVPKEKIQKTFLSADTRYASPGKESLSASKVTTTLDVAGGTLKKEFEVGLDKSAFVPIALCRNKGGFGSESVAFNALGSYGDLARNKPFANVSGIEGAPLLSTPMKPGEERVIRHVLPKGDSTFETVLKVYR